MGQKYNIVLQFIVLRHLNHLCIVICIVGAPNDQKFDLYASPAQNSDSFDNSILGLFGNDTRNNCKHRQVLALAYLTLVNSGEYRFLAKVFA